MKLRKFFGLTSRSVLEQVRNELGADAVIVANRATADGIEISALPSTAMDTLLDEMPAAPRARAPQPARAEKRDTRREAGEAEVEAESQTAAIAERATGASRAAPLPPTPQAWAPALLASVRGAPVETPIFAAAENKQAVAVDKTAPTQLA